MNPIDYYRRLFSYDQWANLEALASLKRAGTPPERSVKIMAHIIAAEYVWLLRLQGKPSSVPIWPDLTLGDCTEQLTALPALWRDYLDSRGVDGLSEPIPYVNSRGDNFTNAVGDILTHVLMHSMYHRGQIASGLGGAGHQAASTDFIFWVRAGRDK